MNERSDARLAALEAALLRLIEWSGASQALAAEVARLRGGGGQAWRPIETAPRDGLILVYAPGYQGLGSIICPCVWHEDAGFCVDELRRPTHWLPLPPPPTRLRDCGTSDKGAVTGDA